MKVYFSSIGAYLNEDKSMDLFIKGNNGNKIECYFKDLNIRDVNLTFTLIIEWADGSTTNELLMNKSLDGKYVYLTLPTLREAGETKFNVIVKQNNVIQFTSIFKRVIADSLEASDNTNITPEEYEAMQNAINDLSSNISEVNGLAELNADHIQDLEQEINTKQPILVSGSNIKKVNGEDLVGEGNVNLDKYYYRKEQIDANNTSINGKIAENAQGISYLEEKKIDALLFEQFLLTNADKDYVEERIRALIGDAPDALDTLYELANALKNNPDFATTILEQLKLKADKYQLEDVSASVNDLNRIINNKIEELEKSKQDALVSGVNIKTINGHSIVGEGDIQITGSGTGEGNYASKDDLKATNERVNKIEQDLKGMRVEIDCPHRIEITGNTGDEHALAIDDQQMIIKRIEGRTIIKNQLVNPSGFSNSEKNGITAVNNGDGSVTFNGTNTSAESYIYTFVYPAVIVGKDIKIYMSGLPYQGSSSTFWLSDTYNSKQTYDKEGYIYSTVNDKISISLYIAPNATVSNLVIKPQLINLTLAYGEENEPTTVEKVLNDFPDYIYYNEGEFISSNNTLISTGKNLWKYPEEIITREKYYYLDTPLKAGTYTISAIVESTGTDATQSVISFYSSHTDLANNSMGNIFLERNVRTSQTMTFTKDIYTIKLVAETGWSDSLNDTAIFKDFQIEYGSQMTDYEKYYEEKIEPDVSLSKFDYIDNISNEMYIKHNVVKGSELTYYKFSGFENIFSTSINDKKKGKANILNTQFVYTHKSLAEMPNNSFLGNSGGIEVYIRCDEANNDPDKLKEILKDTYFIYETVEETIFEDINLPYSMYVVSGGMQIQEGNIPYNVVKDYAVSVISQLTNNVYFDRKRDEKIEQIEKELENIKTNEDNNLIVDKTTDAGTESGSIITNVMLEQGLYELSFIDGNNKYSSMFYNNSNNNLINNVLMYVKNTADETVLSNVVFNIVENILILNFAGAGVILKHNCNIQIVKIL